MTREERELKYKEIKELTEWVNTNRETIANDGLNIMMAIGDREMIWRLCLTGNAYQLAIMMKILKDGADDDWKRKTGGEK